MTTSFNPCSTPPPLEGSVPTGCHPTPYEDDWTKKDKMIRKLLAMGYDMHYDKPRSQAEKHMEKKRLCWNHVESWCKSAHCSVRKSPKRMSVEELIKVVSQFEQVHRSFLEAYKRAG